ncbi:DUF4397 domain-containing protein [Nocardioides hwasunensis]|uniref:DUF4397 domain-containing protein n=1 Tax=Nocardioides hwasunensis TaxID=397258 RepID=A0ABR8MD22_9ACTN|nr:DUF4397 domain-containing protein [Nocardioides hwasunensis]MBD3913420.1 DUF4397 domain-containing protein [Nocardioides hwasunensis]
MRRRAPIVLAAMLALFVLGPAQSGTASEGPSAPPAQVTVVQAVPGAAVDVSIDGRSVASGAAVGAVLGPFEVAPGSHDVSFTGDGMTVDSSLEVTAGESSDVVLHLPAQVGGDPVVNSYAAPTGPIGPGKARVMLAHTATVAPADVEVDGQTVFTNIANGEFADADVPGGTIKVALLPSGTKDDPILGPLDVSLDSGTLSMIYAYGNPRDGSMNVIAHTSELAADGSVQPSRIDTGSAGLANSPVSTFGHAAPRDAGPLGSVPPLGMLGVSAVVGVVTVLGARRRSRRTPSRPRLG